MTADLYERMITPNEPARGEMVNMIGHDNKRIQRHVSGGMPGNFLPESCGDFPNGREVHFLFCDVAEKRSPVRVQMVTKYHPAEA